MLASSPASFFYVYFLIQVSKLFPTTVSRPVKSICAITLKATVTGSSELAVSIMPGSEIPVIRQRFLPGDLLPYWCARPRIGEHHLYDIDLDPEEDENRLDGADEKDMLDLLHTALTDVEAPEEQFQRLGIS